MISSKPVYRPRKTRAERRRTRNGQSELNDGELSGSEVSFRYSARQALRTTDAISMSLCWWPSGGSATSNAWDSSTAVSLEK
jgi:hypothetical protein